MRQTALVRLWRVDESAPNLGFGSYRSSAERFAIKKYAGAHGVPGDPPWLYEIEIDLASVELLDLCRTDCWDYLKAETGIDEAEYSEGMEGHEILSRREVQKAIADRGFDWSVNLEFAFRTRRVIELDAKEEWIFFGQSALQPIKASRLDPQDSGWVRYERSARSRNRPLR